MNPHFSLQTANLALQQHAVSIKSNTLSFNQVDRNTHAEISYLTSYQPRLITSLTSIDQNTSTRVAKSIKKRHVPNIRTIRKLETIADDLHKALIHCQHQYENTPSIINHEIDCKRDICNRYSRSACALYPAELIKICLKSMYFDSCYEENINKKITS